MTERSRQIIALGGGGFLMEPENPLLDTFIIASAGIPQPKVCYLPHATDDAVRQCFNFYRAFTRLPARPTHLSLFTPHTADLASFILEQDIIYVGGGNTKSMLALWREWGLDRILAQAYERGIVLAGISAGANCWFEEGLTDSIPGGVQMLRFLGLLRGSFCPHYDSEVGRRPTFKQLLRDDRALDGYAADDGVAAHFINGALAEMVSSRPQARGYRLRRLDGVACEQPLPTRYLGTGASSSGRST